MPLVSRCRAVSDVRIHERSNGRFHTTWEVELFEGNDPGWLQQHQRELLRYIHDELGCPHVRAVKIVGPK
jgi:hypothetical protein